MSAKKEKEYRRLPGRGYANSGPVALARIMSQLYLGKDHLLRVNAGWVETYRRFYYNDIQAIIVGRTKRFLIWTIILAILCAGFLFWCMAIHTEAGRITLGCIAGFFGIFLVGNLLCGPTCRVQVVTQTGSEPLPSLKRLRTARKVIALLKPEIEVAQGVLQAGEIPGRLAELHAATPDGSGRKAKSSSINNYRGAVHGWLFAMLILEALALLFFMLGPGELAGTAVILSVFCVAGLTFVALAKQGGSVLGDGLRNVTWFTLADVIITLVAGYVIWMFVAISNPNIAGDQYAIVHAITAIPLAKTPWLMGVFVFMTGFAAILGLSGLIIWFSSREALMNATVTDTASS